MWCARFPAAHASADRAQAITSGTLVSDAGVEPHLNATLHHGGDWVHTDPDRKHNRLDVRTVFKIGRASCRERV